MTVPGHRVPVSASRLEANCTSAPRNRRVLLTKESLVARPVIRKPTCPGSHGLASPGVLHKVAVEQGPRRLRGAQASADVLQHSVPHAGTREDSGGGPHQAVPSDEPCDECELATATVSPLAVGHTNRQVPQENGS